MIGKRLVLSILMSCFTLTALNANAAEEKTLKFGVIGPFTGPAAQVGAEFKGSVTIAMEKVNYMVGDYKLEPVWIDSQSDPAKVVTAYAEAIERKGIQAGVLYNHSSTAVAAMDVAAQYKVPHMFGLGATEVINQKWKGDPGKYGYWGVKGWPIPAKLMESYVDSIESAIKNGDFKPEAKVMAIACEDTDWGHSAGDAVAVEFEKKGWTVASKDYFPITQTDFYPMLGSYKKKDVAVIFSTSSAAPVTTAFIKQIREVGLKSLVVIDGLGWTGDWYKLAGAASDGVLDMIPQLATPEAKDWAKEFEQKFGITPSATSGGLTYDGTNFFLKLLKRTLEKYGKLDKETIYKVMSEEMFTGKLTFNKADGSLIMNEYRYTMDTMPDMVVARDGYFFPVIQYKGGKGSIVYPEDMAETKLVAP